MSDVEQVLTHPEENDVIGSVSGTRHLQKSALSHMSKLTHWNEIFHIDLQSVLQHLKYIVQEFEDLCLELDIPQHVYKTAEKDYPHNFNKVKTELIVWWMDNSPDHPCWWHLVQALDNIERSAIANIIKSLHSKL